MRAARRSGGEDLGVPRAEARPPGPGRGGRSTGGDSRFPGPPAFRYPRRLSACRDTSATPRPFYLSPQGPGGEVGAPAGRATPGGRPLGARPVPAPVSPAPTSAGARGLAARTSSAGEGKHRSLITSHVAQ